MTEVPHVQAHVHVRICTFTPASVHVFINVHIDSRISWVIDNQLHSLVPAGVGSNLLFSQELFERLLGFFVGGILWLTYTCTCTCTFELYMHVSQM